MWRKLIAAVAVLMVGSVAGVPVLTTAAARGCTIKGTPRGEILSGTNHHDVICGAGGNDYIAGQRGDDRLRGGPNNDTVIGGRGADYLAGRGGNDKLFAVDGHGSDVVRGGPGHDKCYGEHGDRFRCEQVFHSNSPQYPRALAVAEARALGRVIAVANHQLCRAGIVAVCVKL